MKLDLKLWLVIGLTIVVIILILTRPSPQPIDNTAYHREIESLNQTVYTQSLIISDYAKKSKADSLKSIKTKQLYDSIANRQSAVISDLKRKPRVIEIIKQEPEVKQLVEAQDSLNNLQFQRIAVLEGLEYELRQDMSKVLIACEQRFEAQIEKDKLKDERISDLEKQNRKERRKKKLSQVLIPVVGVAMFLLRAAL